VLEAAGGVEVRDQHHRVDQRDERRQHDQARRGGAQEPDDHGREDEDAQVDHAEIRK
jgi:hypothetical protein